MEQSIELMTGIVLLVLSLSFLLRAEDWAAWCDNVRQRDRFHALPIGMFALSLSAFMVAFHQVWEGFFLLVTVIGLLGIVEGMFYLLFPGSLRGILSVMSTRYKPILRFYGLVMAGLAVVILKQWWDIAAA